MTGWRAIAPIRAHAILWSLCVSYWAHAGSNHIRFGQAATRAGTRLAQPDGLSVIGAVVVVLNLPILIGPASIDDGPCGVMAAERACPWPSTGRG